MKVLLINPGPGDFGRAFSILKVYKPAFFETERERSRHRSVICGVERPAAVWHTPNQITIHFGNGE